MEYLDMAKVSNLVEYAREEMERVWPEKDRDSMQSVVCRNILELIETFSEQGHSGMSAPYVLKYFTRLVNWLPIAPLTGEEDEWGEPYGDDDTQQNKRCSKVFRDHFDNSTAKDIEGRIFVDEEGFTFLSKGSAVKVEFPYNVPDKPKYVKRRRPR